MLLTLFLEGTDLGLNLALNRETAQSSTYTSLGGVSSRAVDGNRDQNFVGNSCMLTDNVPGPQWWAVKLDTVTWITHVSVYLRADKAGEYNTH